MTPSAQLPSRRAFPAASRRRRDQRAKSIRLRDTISKTVSATSPLSAASGWREQIGEIAASPDFWDVALICATACLGLGVVQFAGSDTTFALYVPPIASNTYWILQYKTWWVASIVAGFLIFPAILMAVVPGNRLRDCNLSFEGLRRHFRIYLWLFLAVLPVIWLVSLSPAFYNFYPMYPHAGRSWFDLLAWESLYFAQFIALEFFFRGFLVGGLGRHIGILSVPVSAVPYMMLHFLKPWPEAAASVVAGFVLGYLAWKTKSIWGGVCVHCAVALSMDMMALAHKSQLPWLHH